MSEVTRQGRGRPARRGRVSRNSTDLRNAERERHVGPNRERNPEAGLQPVFRRTLENELSVVPHNLGPLNITCMHCGAFHFAEEATNGHFNACCHNGLINMPQPQVNDDLKELFLHDSNFIKNIRQYNSAMAFASLSATQKEIPGNGPYCFKIQGQVHRYISDLLPRNGELPSYGQLYFIDTSEATNIRLQRKENQDIKQETLSKLTNILTVNPYAQSYKKASDVIVSQDQNHDLEIRFVESISMDLRRFNKPSAAEIAAVFNSTDGEPPQNRHVIVHHRQGGPKLLSVCSPHCDPMVYPLLFPHGEPGWDPEMTHNGHRRQRTRERLTMLQFACYRLAIREGFSHIHASKKLFQQFIVDLYTRVEAGRLYYIRTHQSDLRVEHYKGLQDFVLNGGQLNNLTVGKIVVLPSSFEGSPRNMVQRYQDAMAIVQKFGKPDIFLTITCNPNWPEILSSLDENETPADRPDIVSRVFKGKLNEVKRDILKNNVFGEVVAYVYVIEFQKRGLPHCHMLLILSERSKFREPAEIDQCVCAEIPDSQEYPVLHDIVVKNMIHGPCGKRNPNSPCMKNDSCSKKYPKEFTEETIENSLGYPKYRRRNDGTVARKGLHEVDNRDVVPYNSYMLLKYNAHINVEICSSVRSVKYLFKYVYKGYDSASVEFVNNVNDSNGTVTYDESVNFTNMRYVSSHESIWRLHSNEMHEQSHVIIRLAVHEEGHHNVYFNQGNEQAALHASEEKHTTLTAWFKLNIHDPNARQYLYAEIPQHYRFSSNKWIPRQRGGSKVIGRMYNVAPNDINRFYLRMLLLHVKGATSFNDLRNYNGTLYGTFKEAVSARGLLRDDQEWHRCLQELQNSQMPHQLRQLFAYICCFCEPASPLTLWTTFKDKLSEDMIEMEAQEAEVVTLRKIQIILRENGFDCATLGLPVPPEEVLEQPTYNLDEQEALGRDLYNKLNFEQKTVVDRILNAISGDSGEKLFFLEAAGGCGKTFVYSCILGMIRGRGQIALAGAWTGIAALLLDGGTTLHRLFGLPVPILPSSVSSVKANSSKAETIREASVIIIDEASMVPAAAVDCIDRLLKDLMKCSDPLNGRLPMGGKVVLFGGDFRQVLPVVPLSGRIQIIESCIQKSIVWKHMKILHLTKNMRANEDERLFSNWLLEMGNGTLNATRGSDCVDIHENFIVSEDLLIRHVFGDSINIEIAKTHCDHIIVCPLNENCDKINEEVLNLIEGNLNEYCSVDEVISDDPTEKLNIPVEYINSLTPSGMPPHRLKLKPGAVVMLIRNMSIGNGLVNGVRMLVLERFQNCLKLEIITGIGKGNIIFLPRIKIISTDPNMPFHITRTQFPIRLSFAVTINKAQGQTFKKIGIYLPAPVFTHGQLYVAFSRAKTPQDISVVIKTNSDQGKDKRGYFTKNVVFKDVLLDS